MLPSQREVYIVLHIASKMLVSSTKLCLACGSWADHTEYALHAIDNHHSCFIDTIPMTTKLIIVDKNQRGGQSMNKVAPSVGNSMSRKVSYRQQD